MAKAKNILKRVMSGLTAMALATAPAFAGPEEDYQAGTKAYREGDVIGAMAVLRKAADARHPAAQALLADILDKAEFNEEAVAYYRKSAAQGNPDGEFGLGVMYSAGEGVKRDLVEARAWITRAADKGHRLAINELARAYMAGGLGVDDAQRNSPAALQWIRRAADNGYVPALEYLARAYRSGALGLAVDLKQAEILESRVKAMRGASAAGKGKKAKP